MLIRRTMFYAQPFFALGLPAWLLVGWGLFGPDGWPLLVVLVMAFLLSIAMFVVIGLCYLRTSTRRARTMSWLDAALFLAWDLTVIGIGVYGAFNSTLAVLSILIALAAFWAAVWQLVREAAHRVQSSFHALRFTAAPAPAADPVIVVHERNRD